MRRTLKERRLAAIKQKFVLFPRVCRLCNEEVTFEKMWSVYRWEINKTVHEWCYCKTCIKSAKEVLHQVDNDDYHFGIAFVDRF